MQKAAFVKSNWELQCDKWMTHGGKQAGWINNSQWRESERAEDTERERDEEFGRMG